MLTACLCDPSETETLRNNIQYKYKYVATCDFALQKASSRASGLHRVLPTFAGEVARHSRAPHRRRDGSAFGSASPGEGVFQLFKATNTRTKYLNS